jgi:hypothetical protein
MLDYFQVPNQSDMKNQKLLIKKTIVFKPAKKVYEKSNAKPADTTATSTMLPTTIVIDF